jgi:ribonuclease HI
MLEIYTDGAYSSSRKQGGWAFVVVKNGKRKQTSFGDAVDTTNNRMEIMAALQAMLWMKDHEITEATIWTDSMYVIGTMSQGWKRKKNVDLWIQMDDAVQDLSINWSHVKGHSGNQFNDYCDMLAVHGSHLVCKDE